MTTWSFIKEVLALLAVNSSWLWELWDDRNGDTHDKANHDWVTRGLLFALGALIAWALTDRNYFSALAFAGTSFTLFFPYLENAINLRQRGTDIFAHLSPKAWPDREDWWRLMPWYWRLFVVLVLYFTGFSLYYWEWVVSWNAPYLLNQ